MKNDRDILFKFTEAFMESLYIKTEQVSFNEPLPEQFDLGLRALLADSRPVILSEINGIDPDFMKKSILCFLKDEFSCSYILLPADQQGKKVALIGPYIKEIPEISEIRKMCGTYRIPNDQILSLMQYYGTLPCISDEGILQTYIEVLDRFIDGNGVTVKRIRITPAQREYETGKKNDNAYRFSNLEKRYKNEEIMMEKIAAGDKSGAEEAFIKVNRVGLDIRSSDSVRSKQYYLTVFNTLCRKAAQKGGVHPYYLDEMSRRISVKILKTYSLDGLDRISDEMIQDYCNLVRKYSVRGNSPIVSRAVNYINANLDDQKLSLASAAEALKVSRSYLSARFKDEMHQTMTDFIAKRRIENAQELLAGTQLPVQDIASICGIDDAAYFTRLFKMKTGLSPRQYRKEALSGKR